MKNEENQFGQSDFQRNLQRFSQPLFGLLVFAATVLVYAQYGFQGAITRDTANALYSGQQMARGVAPIVSIFNHSGVLGPMLAGAGVRFANIFHLDDLLTARILFLALASLAVMCLYFLCTTLFESQRFGLLAAFTFIGFGCFGKHAITGPAIKISMVLLQILALLLMVRKRWFWAALCGTLAFFAWQPTAVYALAAIFLAFRQASSRREAVRNAMQAVAGGLIPLLAVSLYFVAKGAFYDLVDGTILFNLYHLEREPSSLASHFLRPIKTIFDSYTMMALPIFFGAFALGLLAVWRWRLRGKRMARLLAEDKFAAILLTFPAPIIWSVLDFQGCPDFYVFLPYVALGFAWLLYQMFRQVMTVLEFAAAAERWSFGLLCAVLITLAAIFYGTVAEKGLREQRRWAGEVESRFGREAKVMSIGLPEAMVLLHRTNPNPYVFIVSGIDNHIQARTVGGFDGWLQQLENYDPDVIAFGTTSGRFKDRLTDWLQTRYTETTVGEWKLLVKKTTKDARPTQGMER
jgi:hypothetical protein